MNKVNKSIAFAILVVSVSCNNPKVIEASSKTSEKSTSTGIFSKESPSSTSKNSTKSTSNAAFSDLHTVTVNEILPTTRYVYLNVNEGNETYWIATRSKDVKVGETYYYSNGLLKTNFESKEYNRVFEKVYLVSKLVSATHGNGNATSVPQTTNMVTKEINQTAANKKSNATISVKQEKGSITIAELVKNKDKYNGKTVQLNGICTKVNAGIMDRNWIHLKDGSNDDFDLVITSQTFIPEGSKITIKATVTLNKNFGAGYSYDLILENGEIIK